MKNEKMYRRIRKMIVMDVRLDNFFAFKDFHMNMSYPKKIVDSCIENEFLKDFPNFRYKKVNVIMGANATGKTSLGRMFMQIFNFMDKKEYEKITKSICDKTREAFFSIDFVSEGETLYRVKTLIAPLHGERYQGSDIEVSVRSVKINKRDNYEACISRLEELKEEKGETYIEELEKVKGLSWMFKYPNDDDEAHYYKAPMNEGRYLRVLEHILKALDPSIKRVEKIGEVENSYVIRIGNNSVIIQDGKMIQGNLLSSGTKAGIDVADMVTAILEEECTFYYCDEKFSYIHSDIEKAILSIMITSLRDNDQIFFTTHNTDILDMSLPKHSFVFLRKDVNNEEMPVECVSASSLLKRNTDSLKHAVENDLFSVAPATDQIYEITDL